MSNIDNYCIRCGKKRILKKTWEEYKGNSLLSYSKYVCPDEDCQKIVEKKLKKEKDHLEAIQTRAENRRKRNLKKRRAKKKV